MTITGTLAWVIVYGIVRDGFFIDRQKEKGWSLPRFERFQAPG